MAPLQYDGQLARFDITIPARDPYPEWGDLATALAGWAKKFVFQLEKGEQNDYFHWQCRVNLISKKTCPNLLTSAVADIGGHWSVTSNGVHSGPKAFNYVMKKDTRVEGPWTDADIPPVPPPLTNNVRKFYERTPYPWQDFAKRVLAQTMDDRHMHCIVDTLYDSGKSTLSELLEYEGLAEEIPGIFTCGEDIIQFAMSRPPAKCYTFDMPAAMKKEKLHGMYQGLECLKNGLLYDKRYKGRKLRLEQRPAIIVFTNTPPNKSLMAPDRWVIWHMQPDKTILRERPVRTPSIPSQSAASSSTAPPQPVRFTWCPHCSGGCDMCVTTDGGPEMDYSSEELHPYD